MIKCPSTPAEYDDSPQDGKHKFDDGWCIFCSEKEGKGMEEAGARKTMEELIADKDAMRTYIKQLKEINLNNVSNKDYEIERLKAELFNKQSEHDTMIEDANQKTNELGADRDRLKEKIKRLEAENDTYTSRIVQLSIELEHSQDGVMKERDKLRGALEFYADPETYFGVAFLCDPPCGDFTTDESETNTELGIRPGKRAREALKGGSPKSEVDYQLVQKQVESGQLKKHQDECAEEESQQEECNERPTIIGDCFGVKLIHESNNHLLAQLLVEDDGNWFTHGNPFDVMWIDDIISVLKRMKICIEVDEIRNG